MSRLPALALAAALLLLAGCQAQGDGKPRLARELDEAVLVEAERAATVRLPDPWEATAPQRAGAVHYRLALPDAALASRQSALFVPRVGNVYRIALNGQPLLSVGSVPADGRPLPDFSYAPVLLPLPQALLGRSANRVEIEVIGAPRREAGLSRVWVGPLDEIEPMHTALVNRQVRGTWVLTAAAVVMGTLALLLAWRARRSGYAWFGAASLLWAWRLSGMQIQAGDAWTPIGTVLFHASYAWFVALMALYALDAVGRGSARAARAMAAWSALALALSAGAWWLNAPVLRSIVLAGTLAVALWLAAVLLRTAWRERSLPAELLSAVAVASTALGARDFWVLRVLQDYGAWTWTRYTILLLLAVLAWLLVDEFSRSGAALKEMNRALQERVAQKEAELQAAFEASRAGERQQAVLAERDRILREMHDGLGGRLVAALALTSQVARQSAAPPGGAPRVVDEPLRDLKLTLDDCLVELRLALDSLETDVRPLIEALAELRFRVEPSLRAGGLRLVWQVDEAASDAALPAEATLHVLRIVREALTNVLKHAQASVVWLRLERRADGRLVLAVVDNGLQQREAAGAPTGDDAAGAPAPAGGEDAASAKPGAGRGLTNMRKRADALAAELDSGPHPEGWAVRLVLPAPATDAGAAAA